MIKITKLKNNMFYINKNEIKVIMNMMSDETNEINWNKFNLKEIKKILQKKIWYKHHKSWIVSK